jgi:hypothetical protein
VSKHTQQVRVVDMNLKMIDENPELKEKLSLMFQLMGEEEGHTQGIKDREAGGEQNPATALGSSSMQRRGSSAAIQTPGTHGIPQGLLDQLNTEGAYDYLNENFSAPDPRIGREMGDINQTYQTGAGAAYGKAAEPYNVTKSSLLEKILMGGGAAALVAAAIGGKRVNPKLVGTMMGLGFGAVKDAPGGYKRRQNRELGIELGRLGSERDAGFAPLQAELDQFNVGQDVLKKNIDQDVIMAGMGMEQGGFGLRAEEQAMRKRGTYSGGPGADDLTMEKMLTRAIRTGDFSQLKRAGRYQGLTPAEMYDRAYQDLMIMKFGSTRVGGMNLRTGMLDVENPDDLINIPGTPSTSQVGRAEKDLQKAKDKAALGVGQTLWETVPEEPATSAIEGWARDRKGYPIAPEDTTLMNDIISQGGTGDLRKKYPVTGQGVPLLGWGSDVFHGDTLGTNPDLITAAQGFKDLIPMGTGDWMKRNPKFYGQDSTQVEAKRDALNAMGMGPTPDQIAQAEGFKDATALWTHAVQMHKMGRMSRESLDELAKDLKIQSGN